MSRHRSDDAERSLHVRWADGVLPPGRLFATAPEAAEILRADPRTVRRALEAGEIPGLRVGGRWRIPVAWLRQQAGQGGDSAPAA
jgi:excisionase family DNA binding protein